MFDGTLGMWNTNPVEFEFRDYVKLVCSQPYPVTSLHIDMFKNSLDILVRLGVLDHANKS